MAPPIKERSGDSDEECSASNLGRERAPSPENTTQLSTQPATRGVKATITSTAPRLWHVFGPQLAEPLALQLGRSAVHVGRDVAPPGLKVRDTQMSRLHFRIARDPRLLVYRIADAGSTNGIFVNGERVTMSVLEPGSVIRAGNSLFVYDQTDSNLDFEEQALEAAPSTLSILVQGETGTGKEWLARRIHDASARKGRFLAINCAALPPELATAELFGHTRGAFSGAAQERAGLFVAAHGGTLFLDEIADLPANLQPILLRILEDKLVRPVGSDRDVSVDVRIIAACQLDLATAAEQGRFRPDLFARLAQLNVRLPALRDRRSDLVSLLHAISAELDAAVVPTPDAMEALLLWHWPYNVRELRTLVQLAAELRPRAAALDAEFLTRHRPELAAEVQRVTARAASSEPESQSVAPKEALDRVRLRRALDAHHGNVSAVAAEFGRPRTQIYRWLKALGLSQATFRSTRTERK